MTKLALKLMVGDEELRAIGHVAVQWAYLETDLDFVIEILANHDKSKNIEKSQPQSFKRRMENLRKLAPVVLDDCPEALVKILDIANDASSLRSFRDDIVHGHWKLKRSKGKLTTGICVIRQQPTLKVREIVFTAEKAEDIAAKISIVSLKLTLWRQRYVSFENAS